MNVNEEHVAFYYQLGLTITQWANMERSLFYIAAACLSKRDRDTFGSGYFLLDNFRAKLGFVDGLIKSKFSGKKHLKKWETLSDKVRTLSSTRNKLAHHWVMVYPQGTLGRRYVLRPWVSKSDPTKKVSKSSVAPSDALGVRDIIAFRNRLVPVALAIENLSCALEKQPARFPADAEQERDPPTIQGIAHQIREALGPPP